MNQPIPYETRKNPDKLISTLSHIYDAFKESKHTEFPHVLFRDIVINEERIIQ